MNNIDNEQYHSDDQSVLTFLLQHVRGLKPVSTIDELTFDDDITYS